MCDFNSLKLTQLCEDADLRDVTFIIEDVEIKVNKSLMAASCVYFKTMLFGNTNESSQSKIILKSTPKVAFQKVVEYIHCGACHLSGLQDKELLQLVSLAHEYQFHFLLNHLFSQIDLDECNVDFCIEIFNFAFEKDLRDWKDTCLAYFDDIFKEKVNEDVFVKFPKLLIQMVTSRDSFLIKEIDLFKCLLKWKKVNGDEESEGIFDHLRLNLIDIVDFADYILHTKLFNFDDYVNAMRESTYSERKAVFVNQTNEQFCYKTVIGESRVGGITSIMLISNQTLYFHLKTTTSKINYIYFKTENTTPEHFFTVKVMNSKKKIIANKINRVPNSYYKYEVTFVPSIVEVFSITAKKSIHVHSKITFSSEKIE
ncbi:BTB/POZ domain-containing protein 9-like protein [Leptotrombidium deliense]|uniref:BTB/POZ domain-containing protein 9-like protein n=1 Tax=Leptotrombidium deliense TaxID=299467 RepID=A0A443S273_9ACAR|nr:BTB/POZ domain-containing protein 9-like protein [Leptotrombidium deliense]